MRFRFSIFFSSFNIKINLRLKSKPLCHNIIDNKNKNTKQKPITIPTPTAKQTTPTIPQHKPNSYKTLTIIMMLGTFPKAFSQAATSQGYYPKCQLPKCAISQAATSQVCSSRSTRPLACSSCSDRPPSPS